MLEHSGPTVLRGPRFVGSGEKCICASCEMQQKWYKSYNTHKYLLNINPSQNLSVILTLQIVFTNIFQQQTHWKRISVSQIGPNFVHGTLVCSVETVTGRCGNSLVVKLPSSRKRTSFIHSFIHSCSVSCNLLPSCMVLLIVFAYCSAYLILLTCILIYHFHSPRLSFS